MGADEPIERGAAVGRVEAFSDGAIAIIVTIMVLELHVPVAEAWAPLLALWPVLLPATSYRWLQGAIRASGHADKAALACHRATERKGVMALAIYAAGVALAFVSPWLGGGGRRRGGSAVVPARKRDRPDAGGLPGRLIRRSA